MRTERKPPPKPISTSWLMFGKNVRSTKWSPSVSKSSVRRLSAHSSQNAIKAMAELAKGIDGLVKHIRAEQADLRIHIEEQGDTNRKLRQLIEAMLREDQGSRPN